MTTPTQERANDARETTRVSLYLTASLFCDDLSSTVKIRNISSSGALLDTAIAPPPGTLVQLVRGSLIVHALVAWSNDEQCGLKFSGSIDVQRWRAPAPNTEQQRVDEIVQLVKAGAVPLPVSTRGQDQSGASAGEYLSSDLRRVAQLLGDLGDRLANDAIVVALHGAEIQNLDIAMQLIGAVEAVLGGQTGLATEETRIASLRKSADQALGRRAA